MRIELISTGNELLDGRTADTNAAYIANALQDIGLSLSRVTVIGDNQHTIVEVLTQAKSRSDLILMTGGLGPTDDDLTRDVLATFLNAPLQWNARAMEIVSRHFQKTNRTMPDINKRQAWIPKNAMPLDNELGTAPGIYVRQGSFELIAMPGVPKEMKAMMTGFVIPALQDTHVKTPPPSIRILRTFGLGESAIAQSIEALPIPDTVTIGYRAHFPEVHIKLSAASGKPLFDDIQVQTASDHIQKCLGRHCFSQNNESLPEAVAKRLIQSKKTVSVAESCTGGLVSHFLTSVPGASAYTTLNLVTYSNTAKHKELNIPLETLNKMGAVSEPVACEMANSIRKKSGSDIGLSITGIAGPDGGSPEKPVGTVWIGLSTSAATNATLFHFHGNRIKIQQRAAHTALFRLWEA